MLRDELLAEMDYLRLVTSGQACIVGRLGFRRVQPPLPRGAVRALQFKAITDGLKANSATIVIEALKSQRPYWCVHHHEPGLPWPC